MNRIIKTTLKLKLKKQVCKLAPRKKSKADGQDLKTYLKPKLKKPVGKLARGKKTKRGRTESPDYCKIETKESSLQTNSKKDN